MASKIGDLIRQRRLELDLTLEQVGEACGVGKSTVRKWETGYIKNMRRDKIALLASILHLDPSEFIDGASDVITLPKGLIPINQLQRKQIPVIGSVAAGEPIFDPEFPDVIVDGPLDADFALRVKGDSMEPSYLDGDLIYLKSTPDIPHNGATCAIAIDDEVTLKRVYKHTHDVTLISNNPAYDPMVFEFSEHTIRVLGVPIGYTRIYK